MRRELSRELSCDRNLARVVTPERNGSERIGIDRIGSEAKPCGVNLFRGLPQTDRATDAIYRW